MFDPVPTDKKYLNKWYYSISVIWIYFVNNYFILLY